MVQAPAASNSPVPRSPEEIVTFLDEEFTPEAVEEVEQVVVKTSKTRTVLNSPVLLIALLAVLAGSLYFNLRELGPEGVVFERDASRAAAMAEQFHGRYGSMEEGATLYVVENGRFKVFGIDEAGEEPVSIMDEAIALGSRDGVEVFVTESGMLLSQNATGDLVFEDETYPRIR